MTFARFAVLIICPLVCLSAVFFLYGDMIGRHAAHVNPVCIVIDPNGVPAPASCTNPDAYQVSDGN